MLPSLPREEELGVMNERLRQLQVMQHEVCVTCGEANSSVIALKTHFQHIDLTSIFPSMYYIDCSFTTERLIHSCETRLGSQSSLAFIVDTQAAAFCCLVYMCVHSNHKPAGMLAT